MIVLPLRRPAFVLALVLGWSAAAAAQTIQVTPLTRDDRVLITFRLSDAFTDEVRSAVHSGLTITFIYDVELKRGASLWLDRTIASSTVSAGVRFDNLTRRYHVTRRWDGRMERVEVLDREEDVRDWLTTFEKLSLFSNATLEPNAEYYLRVRARTTPRNAAFVWPWQGSDVAGLAKFTFLR
ncbi:MAG TPA: DUF4390 domain-containing protein [Vicinamibacterales bacterium]|jgi:hypothetical protein|nr:DUF4390 domain-containing protein [Vicinamibacterales bacterium]